MNFDHSLKSFLKRYSITIEMHSPFALRQTSGEPQSHVLYFDVCNNSIYKGKAKRGCISSLISRKILFCKEQQLKAFQPQSSHKWCYTWTSIQLFCSSCWNFIIVWRFSLHSRKQVRSKYVKRVQQHARVMFVSRMKIDLFVCLFATSPCKFHVVWFMHSWKM